MHELLPMFGHTHGSRSPVTCHIKCGNACAHPAPNTSTEPTFAEIASRQLTRRSVLISTGAIAAVAALPTTGLLTPAAAAPKVAGLPFTPIEPEEELTDAVIVPAGYQWDTIVRWGDPLFSDSRPFNPEVPNAEVAARQFGYNNDYLDILVTDRLARRALLCCNHEYTNRPIMYPPTADEREVLKCTMAATGFSVVELRRAGKGRPWRYLRGGDKNRRITANTPIALTGPAAGSALVKTAADPTGRRVNGMLGNCAGGTTPWGTVLAGEENFQNYFVADPTPKESARYGLRDTVPSGFGWEAVDPRFDARNPGYANEPNRFGYIVEIDPYDPTSTPRKHTAMGRLKHEGANIRVDRHGTVVAYMGDDERFDYLYKFVAKRKYRPGKSAAAQRHNKRVLTSGDLYVARFSGTLKPDAYNLGRGVWIPLTLDGKSMVPGMTVDEVCVYTRLAADLVKATPMDRPEDVEPNLKTGKVYLACTNNTDRGKEGKPGPDAPNPRGQSADGKPLNKDGHVIELAEHRSRADATTFAWNIFMLCGDPADPSIKTYFAGWDGPVSPISCPDNVAFDSTGDNLWVATDGAPSAINYLDGLFRVPLDGRERGHVEQFLAVPREAETCGPVIHDRDGSVFVAVQHPGEEGKWDDQHSFFPDYVPANERPGPGEWRGPRPSVIQVTKKR